MKRTIPLNILLLSSLTSIAIAAPKQKYVYTLEWEGDKRENGYELEVFRGQEKLPIIKKVLSTPDYKMELSRPGSYKWRVRLRDGERTGPFSEMAEFEVTDSMNSLNKPLMESPGPETQINPKSEKTTFTWNEPAKDWTYKLEIFSKDSSSPASVQEVSGGKIEVPTITLPEEFSWRVVATSGMGTTSSSQEKFNVKKQSFPVTEKAKTASNVKMNNSLILSAAVGYSNLEFGLDVSGDDSSGFNTKSSFKGPTYFLSAEYLPAYFNKKHSLRANLSKSNMENSGKDYKQTDLSLEYGRLLKESKVSSHWGYIGAGTMLIDFKLPGTEIEAHIVTFAARYFYQTKLSEKWRFTTSAQILIPLQTKLSIPSVKLYPGLDYRINRNWKINSFLIAERQAYRPADIDIVGRSRDASVTFTNFGVGLGVSWFN